MTCTKFYPEEEHRERRRATLTPEDLLALRGELKLLFEEHKCRFASEEIQTVKDFIVIYKETRSLVLKVIIGAFFFMLLVLFVLGVKNNIITIPQSK